MATKRTKRAKATKASATSSLEQLEARIAPSTILVTTLSDNATTPAAGSLRAAIEHANAYSGAGVPKIAFKPGLHGTISLQGDLPALTHSVTISGPGAGALIVNGNAHGLIQIGGTDPLTVTINGLQLKGGQAANGGGVYVNDANATVTISHSTVTGNRAVGQIQGNYTLGAPGAGGGIEVLAGALKLVTTTITKNQAGSLQAGAYSTPQTPAPEFAADGSGGGLDVGAQGVVTIMGGTIGSNAAGTGGGIHVAAMGKISAKGTKVLQNTSQTGGGLDVEGIAVLTSTTFSGNSAGNGGGVYINDPAAVVTISRSIVTGNRATGDSTTADTGSYGAGGGIGVNAGTLNLVSSTISMNKAGGLVGLYNPKTMTTKYVFQSVGTGGGIEIGGQGSVTITGGSVAGNAAGTGGGVQVLSMGALTASKVVISHNTASTGGGLDSAGQVDLKSSTVTGNSAQTGGGIHNSGTLTVELNSTVSANIAKSASYSTVAAGGGIMNEDGGMVTVSASKITGNIAQAAAAPKPSDSMYAGGGGSDAGTGGAARGGGIFNSGMGTVSVVSSKITGNKAIGGKGGAGSAGADGMQYSASYSKPVRGGKGDVGGDGGSGGAAYGGGIDNEGTLSIDEAPAGMTITVKTKITGNTAIGGTGGTGGRGGRGGQGSEGMKAVIMYGKVQYAAVPVGPGGAGGPGGPGGAGGASTGGGIFDASGTVSDPSGNIHMAGAKGLKGAAGAPGAPGTIYQGPGDYGDAIAGAHRSPTISFFAERK
jgi:hypothetical protein